MWQDKVEWHQFEILANRLMPTIMIVESQSYHLIRGERKCKDVYQVIRFYEPLIGAHLGVGNITL